jgi:hypothetical protein
MPATSVAAVEASVVAEASAVEVASKEAAALVEVPFRRLWL